MQRLLIALVLAAALGGCFNIYRIDVAQGNIVTQDMVNLLKPGMTRSQVRFVLGTPLVVDPFHKDHWDYYYSLRKGGADKTETRHIVVIFKDDVLKSVEGDIVIKNADDPAPTSTKPSEATTTPNQNPDSARAL